MNPFGISKGIESLPKYALKPKPGASLKLARKGTKDLARDARSRGKGAFLKAKRS